MAPRFDSSLATAAASSLVFRSLVLLVIVAAGLSIAGCGGSDTSEPAQTRRAAALPESQSLSVGSYVLIKETRITRTVFEYTYSASVTNSGTAALRNVNATASSTSPNTTIVDGQLAFGDVGSLQTVASSDTFTIRHNRLYAFSWSNLVWDIAFEPLQPSNVRTVGPQGGTFTFPNGVVLDVPAGAVGQTVDITITDVPAEHANAVQSPSPVSSHARRFLGGFVAEPSGLAFQVPVKATFPVQSTRPGELVLPMVYDPVVQRYRVTAGTVQYLGDQKTAQIEVSHFSEEAAFGYKAQVSNDPLADCKTASGNGAPECKAADLYQPACCLMRRDLDPKDPNLRPANCVCCREIKAVVVTAQVDFEVAGSNKQCQISSNNVTATYPYCTRKQRDPYDENESQWDPVDPLVEPTPKEVFEAELSTDFTYELTVRPSSQLLTMCQESPPFQAQVTCKAKDGTVTLTSSIPPPVYWSTANLQIATVKNPDWPSETGILIAGTDAGTTEIEARVYPGSPTYGTATVAVVEPVLVITGVSGDSFDLSVGQSRQLFSTCDRCVGPLNWTSDSWTSNPPGKISFSSPQGDEVTVLGLGVGDALITARSYYCNGSKSVFDTTIVEVQPPSNIAVQARLSNCDWNANYCEFPSSSTPVPLTVKAYVEQNGQMLPVSGAEIRVGLSDTYLLASPATGLTDSNGEFRSTISGLKIKKPFIIAGVNAKLGTATASTQVRGITKDICYYELFNALPNGAVDEGERVDAEGTHAETSEFGVAYRQFSGSAYAFARTKEGDLIGTGTVSATSISHYGKWWDTLLIVPNNLQNLRTPITFDLDLITSAAGDAQGEGVVYHSAVSGIYGEYRAYVASASDNYAGQFLNVAYCKPPCSWADNPVVASRLVFDWSSGFGNRFGIPLRVWFRLGVVASATAEAYGDPYVSPFIQYASSATGTVQVNSSLLGISNLSPPTVPYTVFSCSGTPYR